MRFYSACKEAVQVAEPLELERVSGGVEQKERTLFAELSAKTYVRFNLEMDAGFAQPSDEVFPLLHRQHKAEMGYGDGIAVDPVAPGHRRHLFDEMADELVARQFKIDPARIAAAFAAPEQVAIEGARLFQVENRNSEVEGRDTGWFFHINLYL